MGIATTLSLPSTFSNSSNTQSFYPILEKSQNSTNSMSQDYQHQHHHHPSHHQQGIFGFSNGFERSNTPVEDNSPHHHQQQQIQRDKVRLQGFDSQQPPLQPPPPSLIDNIEEEQEALPVYETTGMLSEMFNFPHSASPAAELLEQQQQMGSTASFRSSSRTPPPPTPHGIANSSDWYGNRQTILTDSKNHLHNNGDSSGSSIFHHQNHQISNINAESAAAMQLFLMNPQTTRSPSPPPPQPHHPSSTNSSTLHMLLPNPSTTNLQGFNSGAGGSFGQFTWGHGSTQEGGATTSHHQPEIGSVVEGQGLSLSLSSSLQQHHSDELRMGDAAGFLYYNQGGQGPSPGPSYKNLHHHHHLQGGGLGQISHIHQGHIGFGSSSSSSLGVVNVLRNSKYVKAAQELLEEFCSVGRGQFKKNKFSRQLSNPNSNQGGGSINGGASSSSSKDVSPLSPADRIEHQRRKVKLLTMLDEVCILSLLLSLSKLFFTFSHSSRVKLLSKLFNLLF